MSTFMYRFPACRLGLSGVFCVLCVLEVGRASLTPHSSQRRPLPLEAMYNAEIRQSLLDGEGLGLPEEGARDRPMSLPQKEAAARSLSYLSV